MKQAEEQSGEQVAEVASKDVPGGTSTDRLDGYRGALRDLGAAREKVATLRELEASLRAQSDWS